MAASPDPGDWLCLTVIVSTESAKRYNKSLALVSEYVIKSKLSAVPLSAATTVAVSTGVIFPHAIVLVLGVNPSIPSWSWPVFHAFTDTWSPESEPVATVLWPPKAFLAMI